MGLCKKSWSMADFRSTRCEYFFPTNTDLISLCGNGAVPQKSLAHTSRRPFEMVEQQQTRLSNHCQSCKEIPVYFGNFCAPERRKAGELISHRRNCLKPKMMLFLIKLILVHVCIYCLGQLTKRRGQYHIEHKYRYLDIIASNIVSLWYHPALVECSNSVAMVRLWRKCNHNTQFNNDVKLFQ